MKYIASIAAFIISILLMKNKLRFVNVSGPDQ